MLKEEGQHEKSKLRKLQSNFIFQEAVAEHKNIAAEQPKTSDSNEHSCTDNSEDKKEIKTLTCRNSFGGNCANEVTFEVPGFSNEVFESEYDNLDRDSI